MRPLCCQLMLMTLVVWIIAGTGLLNAEETVPASHATDTASADGGSIEQLEQFVTALALAYIPHTYEDLGDWGKQSQRWDGLKVRLDGLRIKTKRRKKTVNHGTWKKYKVSLYEPQKKAFQIDLANLSRSEQGTVSFDIQITAPLHVHGRISKWIKGVQLFSISADAIAKVRLTARVEVEPFLIVAEFPPAFGISPHVEKADVTLIDFQMYRVSEVGGEIAQQIGRGAESIIRKRLDKQRPKLADKLNKALKKKQDKLRISPQELLTSKWGKFAKDYLSETGELNRSSDKVDDE